MSGRLGKYAQRIDMTAGCWIWLGTRSTRGYGRIFQGGKPLQAHRVIYELLVGPIPIGMTIDHLCRNRLCVNPSHLEPVTDRVNRMRGMSPPAISARRNHCARGHEYTLESTRINDGARVCRVCDREQTKARRKDPERRARKNASDRLYRKLRSAK